SLCTSNTQRSPAFHHCSWQPFSISTGSDGRRHIQQRCSRSCRPRANLSPYLWGRCRRGEPLLLSDPKSGHFHRIRSISKEDVMPVVDAVFVAVIVAAFAVFAGVLAWAEYQTRDLPPRSR